MKTEVRYKLFREIMWDYNISPSDIDAVLTDKMPSVCHYTKQTLFVKLLETYPWFTIVQLFSVSELKQLLTNETINRLRFQSLKTKYSYVQKRLQ
jgi:hypothetical protein